MNEWKRKKKKKKMGENEGETFKKNDYQVNKRKIIIIR